MKNMLEVFLAIVIHSMYLFYDMMLKMLDLVKSYRVMGVKSKSIMQISKN